MAIYHCSIKTVSRSTGRSAPAAAAYRSGTEIVNQRDGLVHNYKNRGDVDHAEIVLPKGSNAEWARNRSALWNAAEAAENRKDARVAREIVIALPHELDAGQRVALAQDFAQELADRYGVAVDIAIHQPSEKGDERNVHAHVLMTTRKVEADGFGEKSRFEMQDKALRAMGLPTGAQQVRAVRELWEERANFFLKQAGLDLRIDHRSHKERGLEIEPTQHQGVRATNMQRDGKEVERERISPEAAERNANKIIEKPERILEIITSEKSVFDHRDVARALDRCVAPERFQETYACVMASPALVKLSPEITLDDGYIQAAKFSTVRMVEIEASMARHADNLASSGGYGVAPKVVDRVLSEGPFQFSDEQQSAVRHLTGEERIAAVIGFAGAGKSTMLNSARQAWERQGLRVHGAALAGKAAEGLEESSGIESRTLASWERSWENDRNRLGRGDVLVIDEAGMVSSPQLERFIREADEAGAKIVLVGDDEQLQPIGPGAAFRAVVERVGRAEISEVRRQDEQWQRDASRQFGLHQTREALAAYDQRGYVEVHEDAERVRDAIVRDYIEDMDQRPDGSRLALAHRNVDVRELNAAIREARQARGELAEEHTYSTTEGQRHFAAGDRLLFRENNRDLRVKNGMLATVERVEEGRIVARLDSQQGPGKGRAVEVSTKAYAAVDHGYAATIHKSQGATVDRAFVRASGSMDRHMTYVAMTRHRENVVMYAAAKEFGGKHAEQVKAQLYGRLSRSQVKETTLDYRDAYAGRRGFDPIVVPGRDIEKAVQRAAERSAAPTAARQEPETAVQRTETLADRMKQLPDDHLLVQRGGTGYRAKTPQQIHEAIEASQVVREAQQAIGERERVQGQADRLRQSLAELDGAGWLKRSMSGAERKQLQAGIDRHERQLGAMASRPELETTLRDARAAAMQEIHRKAELIKAADAEYQRRAPGRQLDQLAKEYQRGSLQGVSREQRSMLDDYVRAPESERGQMREQANELGANQAVQQQREMQKQKEHDRGFGL